MYRGSFNPPTNAHLEIGGDALFEICRHNARKGEIKNEDLAHRIRMLNLLGKGVLIIQHHSHFVQLADELERRGGSPDIEYIMGTDTFNQVCKDASEGRNGYYRDLDRLTKMSIVVNERDGVPLHPLKDKLKIRVLSRHNNYSSTQARSGDHSQINSLVRDYIVQNNLY